MRLDGDARAHRLSPGQPLSIAYVVRVAFEDASALDPYLAWLRVHVEHVRAAGATSAEIVRVDGEPAFEIRYTFVSREAFARYERDDAPRLRKEGSDELSRLGLTARFSRWTGEIVSSAP